MSGFSGNFGFKLLLEPKLRQFMYWINQIQNRVQASESFRKSFRESFKLSFSER
jgi:hypothetical protein